MRLSSAALSSLSQQLPVPEYDRRSARTGDIHIGVGGFHRSHEAMYHDRMMAGGALEWGICGVGLLPGDRRMHEVLKAQDCLYTLVIKHADGCQERRVIGSLLEHLYAPADPEAVVQRLASRMTRVVSLTLTEAGYGVDDRTRTFDSTRPDVQQDLLATDGWQTAFGLVVEALDRRRRQGLAPFTVMSCDNLIDNGIVARTAFASFGALRDPELGAWIEETVPFPNSVVDRITPATTDQDRLELLQSVNVEDGWPVVCEPFSQWVLEHEPSAEAPPYQSVGVQLTHEVATYEQMKLRLLNAGHQLVAYLGALSGHRFVHEAVADPEIRQFLVGYLQQEAAPTISAVAQSQLESFTTSVPERFANPYILDTLERLAVDASARIPKFLLPVIANQLARGGPVGHGCTAIAAWSLCLKRRQLGMEDRRAAELSLLASGDGREALSFIGYRPVFGPLADDERFASEFLAARSRLENGGVAAALAALP